jgi:cell division protease FtsH
MQLRRFSRAPLLLAGVAVLLLLFGLGRANPGNSYQQASSSEIVALIHQGQARSALISDKNQLIQITTKSGRQLEASWVAGQGLQFQNALQAQLDKGSLPGGYGVSVAKSNAMLLDVLAPAFIYLVIFLLSFWFLDYPAGIRRWRAIARAI